MYTSPWLGKNRNLRRVPREAIVSAEVMCVCPFFTAARSDRHDEQDASRLPESIACHSFWASRVRQGGRADSGQCVNREASSSARRLSRRDEPSERSANSGNVARRSISGCVQPGLFPRVPADSRTRSAAEQARPPRGQRPGPEMKRSAKPPQGTVTANYIRPADILTLRKTRPAG